MITIRTFNVIYYTLSYLMLSAYLFHFREAKHALTEFILHSDMEAQAKTLLI